jgi:uncharacterized protein (TIGR02328 family)
MRLWHIDLVPYLPDMQLKGQHRECCALRGNGWGKKHEVVNYVFTHHPALLYNYHVAIMNEMRARGVNVNEIWYDATHRGDKCEPYTQDEIHYENPTRYPEHNAAYLQECILNLAEKGNEPFVYVASKVYGVTFNVQNR